MKFSELYGHANHKSAKCPRKCECSNSVKSHRLVQPNITRFLSLFVRASGDHDDGGFLKKMTNCDMDFGDTDKEKEKSAMSLPQSSLWTRDKYWKTILIIHNLVKTTFMRREREREIVSHQAKHVLRSRRFISINNYCAKKTKTKQKNYVKVIGNRCAETMRASRHALQYLPTFSVSKAPRPAAEPARKWVIAVNTSLTATSFRGEENHFFLFH